MKSLAKKEEVKVSIYTFFKVFAMELVQHSQFIDGQCSCLWTIVHEIGWIQIQRQRIPFPIPMSFWEHH